MVMVTATATTTLDLPSTVELARDLANNDKKQRYQATRSVERFLRERGQDLEEVDFLKLWKGMWMSDKRPVQQDLARRLAHFMTVFEGDQATQSAARYFHAFWFTMVREWRGLDVLRLDKFYYLMRVMLGTAFEMMRDSQWDEATIHAFNSALAATVLSPHELAVHRVPAALYNHLTDNVLSTLRAFVGGENETLPPAEVVLSLVEPLTAVLSTVAEKRIAEKMLNAVHLALLDEESVHEAVVAVLLDMHDASAVPALTRTRIHNALVARGIVKPAAEELPNLLPPGAKRKAQADGEETVAKTAKKAKAGNSVEEAQAVPATTTTTESNITPTLRRLPFRRPQFNINTPSTSCTEAPKKQAKKEATVKPVESRSKHVHFGENDVKLFFKRQTIGKAAPPTAANSENIAAAPSSPSLKPALKKPSSPIIEVEYLEADDVRNAVWTASSASEEDEMMGYVHELDNVVEPKAANGNKGGKKMKKGNGKAQRNRARARPTAADFM